MTRTFNPENAIRLACLRTAYRHEWQLYQADRLRLRVELGEKRDLSSSIKIADKERLKSEAILFAATHGNYEPLKKSLEEEIDLSNFSKFIKLEAAIPAKGEPFRPPRPSWQDPEIINAPNPEEEEEEPEE